MIISEDLCYSGDGNPTRCLDLHLPAQEQPAPLVVYIHGGGWQEGSYKDCRYTWVAEHGFALASIGYRLTDVACFPAQIYDCKAAVRWLRAHANAYGYSCERIAVVGSSAGGHLAMLLGMSNGDPRLEGDVGNYLQQSSSAQAIINYYGPADFPLALATQPDALKNDHGARAFLDADEDGNADEALVALASPVSHVTPSSPPLLSFHGLADDVVYPNQAEQITAVYHEKGAPAEMVLVDGAYHGDDQLYIDQHRSRALEFLKAQLLRNG